jgi:cyclophilin family peptidyl-prolyl cis-trans isomerase
VAASVAIVVLQQRTQQERAATDRGWTDLGQWIGFVEPGAEEGADPAALAAAADRLTGTAAAPWASALLGPVYASEGRYDEALAALGAFRSEFPNHLLTKIPIVGDGGAQGQPIELLEGRVRAMDRLRQQRPELFDNPAPSSDAPRVRLETSEGPIVVALYADQAPGHVANFLSRARSGAYDGTKFHRVHPGFMIQGGDPNTVAGEPSTWGQGGGEETQPQEFSDLAHFPGYLAMAKRDGEVESSVAQFYITLGPAHHLDRQHTVFGKVVEGEGVVSKIGSGQLEEGSVDRPAQPVTLESAVVIE